MPNLLEIIAYCVFFPIVIISGNAVKERVELILSTIFKKKIIVSILIVYAGEIMAVIGGISVVLWIDDVFSKILVHPYEPRCWIYSCDEPNVSNSDNFCDNKHLDIAINDGFNEAKLFFSNCKNIDHDMMRKGSSAFDNFAKNFYHTNSELSFQAETIAIELDYNNAYAHINLGRILLDAGDKDGGTKEMQAAIKINPNISMAHYNYGNILKDEGKFGDAIEEFYYAVRLDSNNLMAFNNLGSALDASGRYSEAIDSYKNAIRLSEGFVEAHIGLCLAYKHENLYKNAIEECTKSINYSGKDYRAYNDLGAIYMAMGQFRNAADQFEKGLLIEPGDPTLTKNLGLARSYLPRTR